MKRAEKVRFAKETDVLYLKLSDLPVAESDEDKPGVILDYAEDDSVVSIEMLNASKKKLQPEKSELKIAS